MSIAGTAAAAPAASPAASTPTPAEVAKLERARDARPGDAQRRVDLGTAYYRVARAALDRGETAPYEQGLDAAMKEWVEALRLQPADPAPHTMMGIVAAYQGRIDDALESFQNARALEPRDPNGYTNIAETLVYAGRDAREVESWLQRGESMGANPAVVELDLCLLRWRDGDAASAERRFRNAAKLDPSVVRVWNEAPVSKPIVSFVDLTNYCCGSPACGPYLARACQKSSLEVVQRQLPAETKLRELRIEMERRRALDRIYAQRKDLDVKVKSPEAEAAPTAAPAEKEKTP